MPSLSSANGPVQIARHPISTRMHHLRIPDKKERKKEVPNFVYCGIFSNREPDGGRMLTNREPSAAEPNVYHNLPTTFMSPTF